MEYNEILDSEERLRVAMLGSDIAVLNELISDDLLFTSHLGALVSKKEDIDIHQSGNLKFASIDLSNTIVKLYENFAVVSVQAEIKATFLGQASNGRFMFTRIWSKQSGALKIVAGHVSQKA
ncbi:uncharacterized protein DUF4440 [Alteromonadaceae bacterium 2753L.S.0a.02]|nr:uncharacterized protein DUF4440 [Alteromonadaceae bacterium 2753L.S.0a.02]